ncbi:MAG: alkaline phosphatase family protein [Rhodobacteraceae bacterium]|nr:alkaline phosphatase family protein [Paracoccaceae bacterium]
MPCKTALTTTALIVALATPLSAQERPALIVQITVDELPGDHLSRFDGSLGPDGLRRLPERGVWYTNAHHAHANTETIVGHTTLASGAKLKPSIWQ